MRAVGLGMSAFRASQIQVSPLSTAAEIRTGMSIRRRRRSGRALQGLSSTKSAAPERRTMPLIRHREAQQQVESERLLREETSLKGTAAHEQLKTNAEHEDTRKPPQERDNLRQDCRPCEGKHRRPTYPLRRRQFMKLDRKHRRSTDSKATAQAQRKP